MQILGIPLFKSVDIAAIPFESLLEMDVDHPFRIIIAQEDEGAFDYKEYEAKLYDRFSNFFGISEIRYDAWEPLGNKWVDMIEVSKDGIQFCLVPQDIYMDKDYLNRLWHYRDYDWIDSSSTLHYGLFNNRWIRYSKPEALTGPNMALKLPVRTIKMNQPKGVDGWLFSMIRPKNNIRLTDYYGEFYIHHFHNLSGSRTANFIKPSPPYYYAEPILLPENIKPIINNLIWKNKLNMEALEN